MEQAAVVAALKVGAMCVGGVVITGLCVYGLYKLYEKFRLEGPHGHGGEGSREFLMTSVDDLKAEAGSCKKKLDGNNNSSPPSKKKSDEKEVDEKLRLIEEKIRRLKELEDEQKLKLLEERIRRLEEELSAERGRNVYSQEMAHNWINNQQAYRSRNGLAEADEASSAASSSSRSVSENSTHKRWSKMTLEEKRNQKCKACDNQAQLIIKKCGHPVLCLECFNHMIPKMGRGKSISECQVCDRKFEEERVSLRVVTVE